MKIHGFIVSFIFVLSSCTKKEENLCSNQVLRVELESRSNSQVKGFLDLKELSSGALEISGKVENLSPGEHGFHVHEIGDCSALDASSAGPHFGHHHEKHADLRQQDRHAGDLGNILADSKGIAMIKIESKKLCLSDPKCSVLGRSFIVHAEPDDLKSQPAGNSGARQACGLIPSTCSSSSGN